MSDPLELFRDWHRRATESSPASLPNAVCLSTVDADGAPHARFVDLKEVRDAGFVFCTSHASPKSRQIDANPRVSLTFWWDHAGLQVRVAGRAERIDEADADRFFRSRGREAQLASWAFEQSAPLVAAEPAAARMAAARARFGDDAVSRPPEWGGYLVAPSRIEFLAFDATRAHRRMLYERRGPDWERTELQP